MRPLEVKQGRNLLRRYCCAFTCLASRSTHLEKAYDLTTGSFLVVVVRSPTRFGWVKWLLDFPRVPFTPNTPLHFFAMLPPERPKKGSTQLS